MPLPPDLAAAINEVVSGVDRRALARAAEELSRRYREGQEDRGPSTRAKALARNDSSEFIVSVADRAAYLVTRMPATYAAVDAVLRELRTRMPDFAPQSLLDLGAGPGTASWAAREIFPSLQKITLIERDAALVEFARKNCSTWNISVDVKISDLATEEFPRADLAVFSYSFGELTEKQRGEALRRALGAADVVVVIEPGTPRGYDVVLRARTAFVLSGAKLVAPCPHEGDCPMAAPQGLKPIPLEDAIGAAEAAPFRKTNHPEHAREDWCHFAARLERTKLHRQLKLGDLGYEDEKFSYVIGAKVETGQVPSLPSDKAARTQSSIDDRQSTLAVARVLRHPYIGKGFVRLELCAQDGLRTETVTRKEGERFKLAKKTCWGEEWP